MNEKKQKDYHIRINPDGYNALRYPTVAPVALHVEMNTSWQGQLICVVIAEFPDNFFMEVGRSGWIKTGDIERARAFAERRVQRLTEAGLADWWFGLVDTAQFKVFADQEDYIAKSVDRLAKERKAFDEQRASRNQ